MEVYIASGDGEAKAVIYQNTSSIKLGEWYDYPVTDYTYVVAVPKNASTNALKFSYIEEETNSPPKDPALEAAASNI